MKEGRKELKEDLHRTSNYDAEKECAHSMHSKSKLINRINRRVVIVSELFTDGDDGGVAVTRIGEELVGQIPRSPQN